MSVEFRADDPDGFTNINTIDVVDKTNERTYNLVTRLSDGDWGASYVQLADVFRRFFLEPFNSNRVELANWQINAKDLQGYTSSRSFGFSLPDGADVIDEVFAYSSEYNGGSTTNGVEAMEAMTIADNNLSFTSDSSSQFIIEFETSEAKAKNYALWFYTADPGVLPVYRIDYDDSLILGDPIQQGELTSITIPWSVINQPDSSVAASSLFGVHVVLYDEAIDSELISGATWFGWEGVSEYFTL